LTPKHIASITVAELAITPETAIKFELALGLPAEFWLNLEGHYQGALARIKEEAQVGKEVL
jgi:HTH-type transcriptional regulator/antitoxin HigA